MPIKMKKDNYLNVLFTFLYTLYCSDSACNGSRKHHFIMEHRQKKK